MTNIEELKRLALAATPGPWFVQSGDDDNHMCMTAISKDGSRTRNNGQFSQEECNSFIAVTLHQLYPWVDADCVNDGANSAYIASASPDVVLSLITQIEAQQAALVKCVEALKEHGTAYHGHLDAYIAAIAEAERVLT